MNRPARLSRLCAVTLVCCAATSTAWAAGQVHVQFVDPQHYADIGVGSVDRQRNLDLLAAHMREWAPLLPDGQRLTIDVLDVDLAGNTHVLFAHPEIRVLRGRADWPQMQLRWTISDAKGTTLRSGDSSISDMSYLTGSATVADQGALTYDLRMLDRWLHRQVLVPGA